MDGEWSSAAGGSVANDSLVRAFFRKKWVIAILIVDVLLLVVIGVIFAINASKTAMIEINVTPLDAEVSINGAGGYKNGTYSFAPGTYEIRISRDGFETKNFTIELAPHNIANITTYLVGENGDFEFYELKDNYESMLLLEEIVGADNNITTDGDSSAEEFVEEYRRNYRLWQDNIPMHYTDYQDTDEGREIIKNITVKANYDEDCAKSLCVKVLMAHTDDKEFVEQILKDQKFNLEYFCIIYEIY